MQTHDMWEAQHEESDATAASSPTVPPPSDCRAIIGAESDDSFTPMREIVSLELLHPEFYWFQAHEAGFF